MNRRTFPRLIAAFAALLLAGGGLFLWLAADRDQAVATPTPLEPVAAPAAVELPAPVAVTAKSREEKRFARYDRDDDGRISLTEYLANRRRNFDKLDVDGDGKLSFEEYAVSGIDKFREVDSSSDGFLSPAEFATTAPKPKPPKPALACNCPPANGQTVAALQQDEE